MKREGFTLIELLAVIVILAIIALIATPIILNIINDARRSTNERSIEMYASAVKNAVATYQLKEGKAPTTFEDLEEYITYEGAEVVCDEEALNGDGSIYLASCKVGNTLVDGYTYGTKQESACTLTDNDGDGVASLSDMITCGTESFYVMNNDGSIITMLAQYNLDVGNYWNTTTTYVAIENPTGIQNEKAKGVLLNAEGTDADYLNIYGTVAFSTTSYWSSTISSYPAYVYNESSNLYQYVSAYETYLKENGINNANATLMSYEQATSLGCDLTTNACSSEVFGESTNGTAPEWVYSTSYWLGSAYSSSTVWSVGSVGDFGNGIVTDADTIGVRPVVTISILELS